MNLNGTVKITTDSSCDLDLETIDTNDIGIAHLKVCDSTTKTEYEDGTITNTKILELLDQGHNVTTSAPSYYEYLQMFKESLKHYEHIIHLSMTSKLSSSYSTAASAIKEIDSSRISIIDTKQLSMGLALTILNAIDYLKELTNISELLQILRDDIKKTEMDIIIQTPKYALSSGRLEAAAIPISNFMEKMGIRLPISMQDGKAKPIISTQIGKYRGSIIKVAIDYFTNTFKNYEQIRSNRAILGTTSKMEDLEKITQEVSAFQNFTELKKIPAGSVITSHAGPNAFALAYVKK